MKPSRADLATRLADVEKRLRAWEVGMTLFMRQDPKEFGPPFEYQVEGEEAVYIGRPLGWARADGGYVLLTWRVKGQKDQFFVYALEEFITMHSDSWAATNDTLCRALYEVARAIARYVRHRLTPCVSVAPEGGAE